MCMVSMRTQVVDSEVMLEFPSLMRSVGVHYFRILFPRIDWRIYARQVLQLPTVSPENQAA